MADYAGLTQINAVPAALQDLKGRIIYLAREQASKRLVALQLQTGPQPGSMWLEVLRRLDASLPNLEERCGFCQRVVPTGSKYCSKCGADLTVMPSGSSDEVLEAVKQATGSRYELLGRMDYGDRGGVVFVMKERSSGRLAALRLHKRTEEASGRRVYDLEHTNVMGRVAQDVGADQSGSPPDTKMLKAVQRAVGSDFEVLGELGRVAAEPPRPEPAPRRTITVKTQVAPVEPPPATRKPDRTLWLALSATAAIILLALGAMWWRSQSSDVRQPPVRVADPPPAASVVPDSGTVRIGGQLPRGATLRIDGRRASFGANRVAAGTHVVEAAAAGYVGASETIRVQAEEVTAWGPRLTPSRREAAAPAPAAATPLPAPGPAPAPAAAKASPPEQGCSALFNASQDWSQVFRQCLDEGSKGTVVAQQILGLLYEKGLGTPSNNTAASDWYRKAAEAGNPKGQLHLGLLLRDGPDGVRRDRDAAVGWFTKAAQQGDPDAMAALARALFRGEGAKKDQVQAVRWYQQAADKGVPVALYELSFIYRDGNGVQRNDSLALDLMERAAKRGYPGADKELPKLRERASKNR
jgi:hypothetical protein